MQHQIANRLNLWMTGNSVWCWMPHECVFPSWMPHGILGKTNATALVAFDTKTACLSWLLYKARFLLYCYGLHVVTGLHALQVEPPVLAPMPPFMVEKVGLLNYKMSYQVSFCTHLQNAGTKHQSGAAATLQARGLGTERKGPDSVRKHCEPFKLSHLISGQVSLTSGYVNLGDEELTSFRGFEFVCKGQTQMLLSLLSVLCQGDAAGDGTFIELVAKILGWCLRASRIVLGV